VKPAARLRRSSDIKSVRARGRALRRDTFTARVARSDEDAPRIAVIAPRTVGRAVARNRARRRVREAFRRALASAGDGRSIDLVITVRPVAAKADFPVIEADVRSALAELGR
jgi:ribonuclease P protein component